MNPSPSSGRLQAGPQWSRPHKMTARGLATQSWLALLRLPASRETTSCSSCPVNPKNSRQTAAKGFFSQLDARLGPKAAATASTVSTVGDGHGKAKLQKEHALS